MKYRRVWRVVCDSATPDMSGRANTTQIMSEVRTRVQADAALLKYAKSGLHTNDNVRVQARLVSEWVDD